MTKDKDKWSYEKALSASRAWRKQIPIQNIPIRRSAPRDLLVTPSRHLNPDFLIPTSSSQSQSRQEVREWVKKNFEALKKRKTIP